MNELIYFAGLLDGEGSFYTNHSSKPSPHGGKQMTVHIAMTDSDVIEWCKEKFGGGNIGERVHPRYKTLYVLRWCGLAAKELALAVAPYMSDRRRSRIEYLTEKYVPSMWNTLCYQDKVAWTAGYFEGEGTLFVQKRESTSGNILRTPTFGLSTADQDAVERVGTLFDLPVQYSHSPTNKRNGHKPLWKVQARKRTTVERIVEVLYPYMFSRRRDKMVELVTRKEVA